LPSNRCAVGVDGLAPTGRPRSGPRRVKNPRLLARLARTGRVGGRARDIEEDPALDEPFRRRGAMDGLAGSGGTRVGTCAQRHGGGPRYGWAHARKDVVLRNLGQGPETTIRRPVWVHRGRIPRADPVLPPYTTERTRRGATVPVGARARKTVIGCAGRMEKPWPTGQAGLRCLSGPASAGMTG